MSVLRSWRVRRWRKELAHVESGIAYLRQSMTDADLDTRQHHEKLIDWGLETWTYLSDHIRIQELQATCHTVMVGTHRDPKSLRDHIRPPERFSKLQCVLWYIALVAGTLVVCAIVGALIGLIAGIINWASLRTS